jgi:hypothetical protein
MPSRVNAGTFLSPVAMPVVTRGIPPRATEGRATFTPRRASSGNSDGFAIKTTNATANPAQTSHPTIVATSTNGCRFLSNPQFGALGSTSLPTIPSVAQSARR